MSDFKMEACSSPAPKGFQGGCGLSPCQTNIKYCFHINYPFTKHQKTSKFMGCDVVLLIFKTSKYIKQKKKELYLFSCLSIFADIWQMLEIYQKFHSTRGAPEERGLHFQPIFVLAFLKSASTQALPSKKKKPGIWISKFCFTYSKEASLGIWKKS